MNVETFREFCLSLPYATEDMPSQNPLAGSR